MHICISTPACNVKHNLFFFVIFKTWQFSVTKQLVIQVQGDSGMLDAKISRSCLGEVIQGQS